jgi:hypothetical protein
MTFDEIEAQLPNGFHDAFLRGIAVDYLQRRAVFDLEVWIAGPDWTIRAEREAYRRVSLTLTGLLLCSLDVPDKVYQEESGIGLRIDRGPAPSTEESVWPGDPLPEGAFRASLIFTGEWSTSLRFAATDAEWEWTSEARTIY